MLRKWLKVRLPATHEAMKALEWIATWKKEHQAGANLVKAIRLYAALERGDLSLLEECFPYLSVAIGTGRPPAWRRDFSPPSVTYAPQSQADEKADLLASLGLDELEL